MEEVDDDFGDLYADVEIQARSVINGISYFSQVYNKENNNYYKVTDSSSKNADSFRDSSAPSGDEDEEGKASRGEPDEGREIDSDSDDDLKIVLNDDCDTAALPDANEVNMSSGGCHAAEENGEFGGFAEAGALGKNQGWNNLSNSDNGLELSPNGAKGGYQSRHFHHKCTSIHTTIFPSSSKGNGTVAVNSYCSTLIRGGKREDNVQKASSSAVARSSFSFSLPWFRTILDVNIVAFEQKPWRQPGADITDFFNFGFDEESWMCYCNQLDELRQQTSSLARTTVYNCSRLKEPSGRAIQVEDSIVERQPSMDAKPTIYRDSDVIHIPVQDFMEDSPGKQALTQKNGSLHKESEDGDSGMDEEKIIYSGDQLSSQSLDGNIRSLDSFIPKRSSQLTDPLPVDVDDHGSDQISDVNWHGDENTTLSSAEGAAKTTQASDKTKEKDKDTCKTVPPMEDTETFLDQQTLNCLSPSYSGSHCELSGDTAYVDYRKVKSHLNRQLPHFGTESQKSVKSDYCTSTAVKGLGRNTKSIDCECYARKGSPVPRNLKHYRRHGRSSERMSRCNYDTTSSTYDTEGLYDVYHLEAGCSRQDIGVYDPDCNDREDLSYCKKYQRFNFYDERVFDYQSHGSSSRWSCRKDQQDVRDETDRHLNRRRDDTDYFLKRRASKEDDELMRRNWPNPERGIIENPLKRKDSRRLIPNYSSSYLDGDRNASWRIEGDHFEFRKAMEDEDYLLRHRFQDGFIQERYGLLEKERKFSDLKYGRYSAFARRGEKTSHRNGEIHDSPSFSMDDTFTNDGDYGRRSSNRFISFCAYRDTHASRAWEHDGLSLRNAHGPSLHDRRERYKRPIQMESMDRSRNSGWYEHKHDAVSRESVINYPDVDVYSERSRPHQQFEVLQHHQDSKVLHWLENKHLSRHRDVDFLAEEALFSFECTLKHARIDDKLKLLNDRKVLQPKFKRNREGNSHNYMDRSSNTLRRGNHEETVQECMELGDLQFVVGEGKPHGRCNDSGHLECDKKYVNMDKDMEEKRIPHGDHNESVSKKVAPRDCPDVNTNLNNVNWLDKYPVAEHNDCLDVEEGQILMEEELNEKPVDEHSRSRNVAVISNIRKVLPDENATKGNKVVEGYDHQRILEMMAKMEKRRERFKEPISQKNKADRIPKPQSNMAVEVPDSSQQRPARKRLWGGS